MTWRIHHGDALDVLRTLPEASAQTCVTSPPYWGLRDYGTATWSGGDPSCAHRGRPKPRQDTTGSGINKGRFAETRGTQPAKTAYSIPVRGACRCGAVREDKQLGLEPTVEEYVDRLLDVMAEVRRVLKPDGTLWLNLGDCYASDAWGGSVGASTLKGASSYLEHNRVARTGPRLPRGLRPKQMVGVPWRVAFALQADGWYLRSDIIWHKPNPLPESVGDRPTKAHEYLFLLAKRERYFYDADAIREPLAPKTFTSFGTKRRPRGDGSGLVKSESFGRDVQERRTRLKTDAYRTADGPHERVNGFNDRWNEAAAEGQLAGANKRTVWTIGTQPFKEAHFATFPPALVRPCVLAGSRPGDVVLDPFCGAATVGLVATQLGRDFCGVDLNGDYVAMGERRIIADAPLLNQPEEATP